MTIMNGSESKFKRFLNTEEYLHLAAVILRANAVLACCLRAVEGRMALRRRYTPAHSTPHRGGHSVRRARADQVGRDRQLDPGKLAPSGHKAAIFLPGPVGAYTPGSIPARAG